MDTINSSLQNIDNKMDKSEVLHPHNDDAHTPLRENETKIDKDVSGAELRRKFGLPCPFFHPPQKCLMKLSNGNLVETHMFYLKPDDQSKQKYILSMKGQCMSDLYELLPSFISALPPNSTIDIFVMVGKINMDEINEEQRQYEEQRKTNEEQQQQSVRQNREMKTLQKNKKQKTNSKCKVT